MTQNDHNENSFAWAFGGDVVRVMPGGMPPPDPPSVGDVTPFLCFLQEKIFGE